VTGKIYNLFLIEGLSERWLRLAPAEQSALMSKIDDALAAVGGRRIIGCDAYWCNEAYRGWGVEEFPDLTALRTFAAAREKLEWYSYMNAWSVLGTLYPGLYRDDFAQPEPGKIYELFLFTGATEAHHQLTQAEQDALDEKEAASRQAAKLIIGADTYWSNEELQMFGVFMFPDLDCVLSHYANLRKIGWRRYMQARSLLGTLWEV
jgi:hypothetical protein